jgi:hypothetical protein
LRHEPARLTHERQSAHIGSKDLGKAAGRNLRRACALCARTGSPKTAKALGLQLPPMLLARADGNGDPRWRAVAEAAEFWNEQLKGAERRLRTASKLRCQPRWFVGPLPAVCSVEPSVGGQRDAQARNGSLLTPCWRTGTRAIGPSPLSGPTVSRGALGGEPRLRGSCIRIRNATCIRPQPRSDA